MTMDMLAARMVIIRIPAPKPAANSILSFVLSGDEVFEQEACGTVVPPLEAVVEEAAEVTVILLVLDIKALEAVVEEVAEVID
jgi:hypothetical protein